MNPRVFDFDEQMKASEGVAASADVKEILIDNLSGALAVHKANTVNDKSGTDWWVECSSGRHLSIDAKVRKLDWWKLKGEDDLALELWSVCEKKVIGWTLNRNKQSDYILWLWEDTKRWCLLPFPMLCAVFNEHKEQWCKDYKRSTQLTSKDTSGFGNYHSECVFVPRREVWAKIYERFSGMNKSLT